MKTSDDKQILEACVEAARSRPCRLCGTSRDGVFGQCNERYRDVAAGGGDRPGRAGRARAGAGVLGRSGRDRLPGTRGLVPGAPACAFAGEDGMAAAVIKAAGGNLWSSSGFDDDASRVMVRATSMALAWEVAGVYPVVEADAARGELRPRRLLADPEGPSYGRWPAPWVPWMSIADVVPWDRPPFRQYAQNGAAGSPQDAFAAVGLPRVGRDAHPVAKALALATLLRSVPWGDGKRTLGSSLLPPPGPFPAVVGVCQGQIFRFGHGGAWEHLFADGADAGSVGLEAIEQAEGHVRVADAIARRRPENANGAAS